MVMYKTMVRVVLKMPVGSENIQFTLILFYFSTSPVFKLLCPQENPQNSAKTSLNTENLASNEAVSKVLPNTVVTNANIKVFAMVWKAAIS